MTLMTNTLANTDMGSNIGADPPAAQILLSFTSMSKCMWGTHVPPFSISWHSSTSTCSIAFAVFTNNSLHKYWRHVHRIDSVNILSSTMHHAWGICPWIGGGVEGENSCSRNFRCSRGKTIKDQGHKSLLLPPQVAGSVCVSKSVLWKREFWEGNVHGKVQIESRVMSWEGRRLAFKLGGRKWVDLES